MRLIDADELLSIVRSMTVVDKSVMHRILIQMPTVDAVPVRHGHWIEDPDDWECQCSECGHLSSCRTVYCSACGARMDGKDGEQHDTDIR